MWSHHIRDGLLHRIQKHNVPVFQCVASFYHYANSTYMGFQAVLCLQLYKASKWNEKSHFRFLCAGKPTFIGVFRATFWLIKEVMTTCSSVFKLQLQIIHIQLGFPNLQSLVQFRVVADLFWKGYQTVQG